MGSDVRLDIRREHRVFHGDKILNFRVIEKREQKAFERFALRRRKDGHFQVRVLDLFEIDVVSGTIRLQPFQILAFSLMFAERTDHSVPQRLLVRADLADDIDESEMTIGIEKRLFGVLRQMRKRDQVGLTAFIPQRFFELPAYTFRVGMDTVQIGRLEVFIIKGNFDLGERGQGAE